MGVKMGKNILIIGASGEIGVSTAEVLLQGGHHLYLHYHSNPTPINKLKQGKYANQIKNSFQADLRFSDSLQLFLEQLPTDIDQVVFSSGKAYFGLFQEMEDEIMDQLIHLHVTAPWKITKAILPQMIQKKSGHIVFITSIWGEIGASCEVAYSSVKGGQNALVKALAKEVAPSGIYVNAVSPGLIATKMNNHLSEDDLRMIEEDIPMLRSGRSDEVANVVAFLLSKKASYINGEIIKVNGAWY